MILIQTAAWLDLNAIVWHGVRLGITLNYITIKVSVE